MGSRGQTKWSRLRQMKWEELRTRFGQEASKRLDLLLYRSGFARQAVTLRPPNAPGARFFFETNNHESAHRASLLRTHLPDEAQAILHEADDVCRHRFHLLGYEKLDYGENIDWHFDAVHNKRSPLLPWFKLDFLNFEIIGDHKVIWELNRHQHLVTLAKAYLLTGEQRYVQELCAQWYQWNKENPYAIGINWSSSLEVAFRTL